MPSLLLELARHVRDVRSDEWLALRIDDLWLDNLFLSVRLNDGSVGVAMNYDQEGDGIPRDVADATREHLLAQTAEQPLLWEMLTSPTDSHAQTALLIGVMSALSAPVLADEKRLSTLGLASLEGRVPLDRFRHLGAAKVVVIGAGGYLAEALRQDWLGGLACCDFNFADTKFKEDNPYLFHRLAEKEVVMDSGSRTLELIEQADIVCLTASTLCNSSLESLLPQPGHGKVVIVEGPSGGVLPGPLFERGVTHLVHNPVDVDYVMLSQRFSRHCAKGLMTVPSGRFIDLILPEQRTVRGQAGLALESP